MQVRRDFLGVNLPHDCRRLLEFVEDAEQMHSPLGFADADDFIKRGLELDPVAWALNWLRFKKLDEPVPFPHAIERGRELVGWGGDRKSEKARNQDRDEPTLIGRGREYDMARLKRDRIDLYTKVASGRCRPMRQ
jgi:hypothetical protein